MKRPSFQWYPGDFRRDTAVQACCFGARSLWREMMDLMHDGEPYGHLAGQSGAAIGHQELARLIGESPATVKKLLAQLEQHGVFCRTEAGVIYSRRMVRDEHNRSVRAAGGALSLRNENVPRPKHTPEDGRKDAGKDGGEGYPSDPSFGGSPSSSSASTTAENNTHVPPDGGTARDGRARPSREAVERVFAYWLKVSGKPRATLNDDRTRRITARLKRFTEADLCAVIDSAHRNPFYRGENDRGTYYGAPETIFKSDSAVEGHLAWADDHPVKQTVAASEADAELRRRLRPEPVSDGPSPWDEP